jgi:glycosyltransferase involved in cell wall biosynthesis
MGTQRPQLRELVICSLEAWDEVWRRNQFLADALLRRSSDLRVLFVEPPTDALFDLARLKAPARPGLTRLREDGRLYSFRPLKPLPRRLGSYSDHSLCNQVVRAASRLNLARPTFWLNDVTYAPLITRMNWPTVYDVTDDWLLAPVAAREVARLTALDKVAIADAQAVVVCSTALAATRGATRKVIVVHNAVDAEHFQRPRPRPRDFPAGPVAVYVGTLHESRLDADLVVKVARASPHATILLVGPDALSAVTRKKLCAERNVLILGARPYQEIPGYLQHADVVCVPHLVTPFTDSLDPIKAYECVAVGTPTIATPVAGFREIADQVTVVGRDKFPRVVAARLAGPPRPSDRGHASRNARWANWADRASEFEAVLLDVSASADLASSHAK